MPSTFLARVSVLRAAMIAALCLVFAVVALVTPLARGAQLESSYRATPRFAPLVLFPLIAVPALLARHGG